MFLRYWFKEGTLKVGDYLLAGKNHGKVKAMLDERVDKMKSGTFYSIYSSWFGWAPTAGDKSKVYEDEKSGKNYP